MLGTIKEYIKADMQAGRQTNIHTDMTHTHTQFPFVCLSIINIHLYLPARKHTQTYTHKAFVIHAWASKGGEKKKKRS